MKKVLIANRGENRREAAVSLHCSACAAGFGDLASLSLFGCSESQP
ncbi:hypothetical protein [Comamonas koreensis]|uniref:Uncharacterized protein n=1 Tax=Comamonas koreensis TaxID=160825 RepID=A0AAW4XV97_9BURK|nr:hypothetical protein [Comamonas koreensis]MCD2165337.1 hypothetical protein [Comamonas koreensis]